MSYDWRKQFNQRTAKNLGCTKPIDFLIAPKAISLLRLESRRVPHDAALQLLVLAQEIIIVVRPDHDVGRLYKVLVPSGNLIQEKLIQAMELWSNYGPGKMFEVFIYNACVHHWLQLLTPMEILLYLGSPFT